LQGLVPPHVDQGVSNLAHPTRLHPAGISHSTTGANAKLNRHVTLKQRLRSASDLNRSARDAPDPITSNKCDL
jgi:hypothetical protein